MRGIVATASAADNAPASIEEAPRLGEMLALSRGRRLVALLLPALAVLRWATTGDAPAVLFLLGLLFVMLAEAEVRIESRLVAAPREWSLLSVRLVYVSGVAIGLHDTTLWFWIAPVLLLLLVLDSALVLSGRGLAVVAVAAALANMIIGTVWTELPGASVVRVGPFETTAGFVFIAFMVFPALSTALHLYSRWVAMTRTRLERAVVELRSARDDLQMSQDQLQSWNRQLNDEVKRQTETLEERNRALAILNAVSFALAEPLESPDAVERATRLVARLLGVRAAQVHARVPDADDLDLFVTVATEDIYAPRLPESLLRSVTADGHPITSGDVVSEEANLGLPYQVVPLVAKGRALGALALIGGETVLDGDRRQMLLLVGREMGVALENARLYREAMEKAGREAFLTDVARLLGPGGRDDRVLNEVLGSLLVQTGAHEAVLVAAPSGAREVIIAGDAVREGGVPFLESLAHSLTNLVSDRSGPMVLGYGGEGPLSEAMRGRGYSTLVVAPIFAMRGDGGLAPDPARQQLSTDDISRLRGTPVLTGSLVVAMTTGRWRRESTELVRRMADIVARRMQSHEVLAIQQRRIRELTGLAEVARTMQSGADLDRLYAGFASALHQLLSYRHLCIARVDDLGALVDLTSFGDRGRPQESPPPLPSDAQHPWFALRSTVLWQRGDSEPPSFVPAEPRYVVVVPMRPKGQMLGIAAVSVPRPLGADQLRIVEQAVEQLALALDGAMLYQQATARASHIQALSNLARIVASVVNLREAFAAFAEEVRWLIPFDRAVMFLLDESEQQVEPYATYPEEVVGPGVADLAASLASVPLEAGSAVTVHRDDPRYAALDWSVFGPDAHEVAAVPVRQGNRTSAVFALASNAAGGYSLTELDALDEVAGLLAVTIERLRLYERAEHSAKHDLLTGLPNYRYLQERMQELHAGIDEPGESAVLVIDMDNLKTFNDSLGHECGDRVIEIVSRELRSACRQEDFVARTGGDEFVIVMEGVGLHAAYSVADRVHAALQEAHEEIPGAPARIGVSVGIATAPEMAKHPSELLQVADQAMYDAKFAGGQRTRAGGATAAQEPRALRGRGVHLAESLVRTVTAGASPAEFAAIGRAQRWLGVIMVRLGATPELVPHVRMLLAQIASERLSTPRRDRDQVLSHYLIGRIRADLEVHPDAKVGYDVISGMIPALLDVAWSTMPRPYGEGLEPEPAVRRYVATHPWVTREEAWGVIEEVVRTTLDRRRAA